MRKVFLNIKIKAVILIEDGVEVSDVANNAIFDLPHPDADLDSWEVDDYEITDSK